MGAKGTGIIFGGGVYVAENTSREASVTEAQSVALVSIGRSRGRGTLLSKKTLAGLF